jgi:hypothetical protein
MKNAYKQLRLIIIAVGCIFLFHRVSQGQTIIFTSEDSTTAVVHRPYYYQVQAYAEPDNETYSLDVALEGMSITPGGLIKWTPADISKGGRVVVRATNSESETGTHEFYINVAEDVVIPASVVSYWNLDENLVDINDSVFNDWRGNHDARVTKTKPLGTNGIIGPAQDLILDNNSEVVVPDASAFNWGSDSSFSIEFWFQMYPGDINKFRVIVGRNQGSGSTDPHWWIGLDPDDHLLFTIRTEDLNTVSASIVDFYTDYEWHHVVAYRNAATHKIGLFVDGNTDTDLPADSTDYDGSGPGFTTTAPLSVGWLKPGSGDLLRYPYPGKIDELIIHNKALSPAEILKRFNDSKNGPGNYAPLFKTMPVTTVNEESPYTYQYLATDLDNDPLAYDTVAGMRPSWLNWNKAARTLSGTPSDNDVGIFNVSIKVNDGHVDIFQNFQITVNNVNDKPALSGLETTALAYVEDDGKVAVTSAIVVSDVDDPNIDSAKVWISANYNNTEDVLAFTNTGNISGVWNASAGVLRLTGTATKAAYQAALRSVTYENTNTVAPDALTRTLSFTVNDGELSSTAVNRNITVESVNDCPVISGHAALTTPEEDTILIRLSHLTFTDVDDGPGSFTVTVTSGSDYAFAGNTVTPAVDFNGTLDVNIRLSDSECTVDYVLPVMVTPVNDPPVFDFSGQPKEAYENQTYLSTIRASDTDPGDEVTFSVIQKPDWLNQIQDTILTGVPEFSDVGENAVTIRISDTHAEVDTTFIITVYSTNYIPHITSSPPTYVNEDELYQYTISVLDTNSKDVLFLSAPVLPEWLTLNATQKTLEGTPTNEYLGTQSSVAFPVKLKVFDGKQDSTQTFTITVYNVNDGPEIMGQADTIITYPDSSIVIELSDLVVQDVDNLLSDLELIVLAGTGYALNENSITIITDQTGLLEVNVRVEDPGKLKDQGILYVRIAIPSSIDIPAITENSPVRVYPTPANDVIHFEILLPGKYNLEIINITGRTILQEMITGNEIKNIDSGNFPEGIYLYKIYKDQTSYTGRIVVRK